jgi:hypothetical protein
VLALKQIEDLRGIVFPNSISRLNLVREFRADQRSANSAAEPKFVGEPARGGVAELFESHRLGECSTSLRCVLRYLQAMSPVLCD